MALSAFDDKTHPPAPDELTATLGKAHAAWAALIDRVGARFGPLSPEWGYTSKSTGWGLRLKHKDRVILYLTPGRGQFLASFVLGEKAVAAAHAAGLPAPILAAIDGARKYAEGRGVRLAVRSVAEVRNLEKLAIVKMSH
jgi:hypothetical protein